MDQETQLRLAELRAKIAAGGQLTLEESREAISLLRHNRAGAAVVSAKAGKAKTAKNAAANVNSDDLLKDLGI